MKARSNIQAKAKMPIKIRFKKLANGNQSIYLDAYRNGKRVYEFLQLYLIPETTPEAKRVNQKTIQLAETIQAQRIVELNTTSHGLKSTQQRSKILLRDYIKIFIKDKTGTTKRNYENLLFHLEQYDPNDTQIGEVDKNYIKGLVSYLGTALSRGKKTVLKESTQTIYFRQLKSVLNEAVIDDVIESNPISHIKKNDLPQSVKSPKREFLTIEELQRFAETKHPNDLLKRAFVIGCLTGLRYCDISQMRWGNVGVMRKGVKCISLIQQKINEVVDIPLNANILKWLPERGEALDDELVFEGLLSIKRIDQILPKWAQMAGINKHLTFHISRHTFAVTALQSGIDIYTVSKLLGHQDIKTTEIYAECLNTTKREAMKKLEVLNV